MRVQQGESLVQILETPATKQQVKDHLFFTYSKFSEKVLFFTPWYSIFVFSSF